MKGGELTQRVIGACWDTPIVEESVQTSSSSVREFLSSAQSPEEH